MLSSNITARAPPLPLLPDLIQFCWWVYIVGIRGLQLHNLTSTEVPSGYYFSYKELLSSCIMKETWGRVNGVFLLLSGIHVLMIHKKYPLRPPTLPLHLDCLCCDHARGAGFVYRRRYDDKMGAQPSAQVFGARGKQGLINHTVLLTGSRQCWD